MDRVNDCEASLGCASTRELLTELDARGVTGQGPDFGANFHTVLHDHASRLLHVLPDWILDYRTVDS